QAVAFRAARSGAVALANLARRQISALLFPAALLRHSSESFLQTNLDPFRLRPIHCKPFPNRHPGHGRFEPIPRLCRLAPEPANLVAEQGFALAPPRG